MLAKGLVDREMLEMLRDRDADVEYWREANQEKSRRLAAVNREREALEQQVLALGGTLNPYRRRGRADAMAMSDEEIEGFADGRGHGAAERARRALSAADVQVKCGGEHEKCRRP